MEVTMHTRASLGLALALCAISAVGCNNGPTFTDGGTGDGNSNNGGTGQVKVRGITPAHGPLVGGTSVVIDGQGFVDLDAGDAIVVIGDRVATQVGIVDDFTITAVVPAGTAPGAVDVIVANKNGYGQLGHGFSYNPMPAVTAVDPPAGDWHGGTAVTITGTGFQDLEAGVNTVTFGDLQASDVTVVSDTQITATTPPGAAFTKADVGVENANGAGSAAKLYTYQGKGLVIADGYQNPSDGLYLVDDQSGLVTRILKTQVDGEDLAFHALATDPDGIIWGVTHYASQPYLVKMDPYAQTVTKVGVVTDDGTGSGSGSGSGSAGQTFECNDLEFVGTTLYCTRACCGTEVYTLDTTDASATAVSTINLTRAGIASVNGVTYATSRDMTFGVVDLGTGTVSNPITSTVRLKKPTGYHGKLYVLDGYGAGELTGIGGNASLYQIDTTTGEATLISVLPVFTISLTKVE
jgi:IPT/TIG domain